ncbi:hypothetical protein HPB51_024588 [Rhipicephalus microplus]|uniref:Uncharacterized protein n=1 Tax=Rhipicephalus microplus TaxID=6941 RepID=A0A9J6DKU1_RHIMP|nr:hypothetical protein HPB51_024588 [Rhipicephalus microplus]
MTTINSDSPDQLDCVDADEFEPTDNVGPNDSTPGPSSVAEASNNTYLRPSVPHTPWFRVIDARRKKVVAEEASATPPATFHQREHRHETGQPRLPRLPVENHKERRCGHCGILNPSEHHDGCAPRCLTCGSDKHPTIDVGCPARQRRPEPLVLRDERQLLEKPNDPPLKQLSEQLPPNNQPRSRPQHASSEGHGRSAPSKRSKTPKHGKQTSQPIQPGVPPPNQATAHSSRNYPPPSSQCSAKSYNTWPALPQREPTHAPGLEARAVALSSSDLAAGCRLDQAPQSQLQRRQAPLAVPGKSPVEQASQNPSRSTPPHSPALVQQTCAQYFRTPEFTQALTQLVLKFVSDSLEAVKTQLINEQEQALQRMETTFSHRMEKVEAASNHLYDMKAQSSPTRKHKQRKSAAGSSQHTAQANSPQSGVSTPTTTQLGEF